MATTTNYGFEIPDDTDLVKDGALAMRDLGQDIDTQLFTALGGDYPGLRLIKTQTVGSAVASVTVTGAFSAAYDNYKIIYSGGSGTNNVAMLMTLGATATGYYTGGVALQYGTSTVIGINSVNATSWNNIGRASTAGNNVSLDLNNPFAADETTFTSSATDSVTVGFYITNSGFVNNTTSYTAFTLTPGGGTITGGTIYVYGYGKS
jgi:hypothetical protein